MSNKPGNIQTEAGVVPAPTFSPIQYDQWENEMMSGGFFPEEKKEELDNALSEEHGSDDEKENNLVLNEMTHAIEGIENWKRQRKSALSKLYAEQSTHVHETTEDEPQDYDATQASLLAELERVRSTASYSSLIGKKNAVLSKRDSKKLERLSGPETLDAPSEIEFGQLQSELLDLKIAAFVDEISDSAKELASEQLDLETADVSVTQHLDSYAGELELVLKALEEVSNPKYENDLKGMSLGLHENDENMAH